MQDSSEPRPTRDLIGQQCKGDGIIIGIITLNRLQEAILTYDAEEARIISECLRTFLDRLADSITQQN